MEETNRHALFSTKLNLINTKNGAVLVINRIERKKHDV